MTYSISLGRIKEGVLTIGNVSAPVYNPNEKIKVPDVLFYDNPQVITHTHSSQYIIYLVRNISPKTNL